MYFNKRQVIIITADDGGDIEEDGTPRVWERA